MMRVENTIFISYRRTNVAWALAIYRDLVSHGYDVFFDFEGLESGDFEQVIFQNIDARAHFLVILTPSALERCDQPGDWLRREIERALDTKRNIVPLVLEGFDFDSPGIAKHLTGKIGLLRRYNAISVPAAYFPAAMERLRKHFLDVPLETVLHPCPSHTAELVEHQRAAAAAAPQIEPRVLSASEWFERSRQSERFDEKLRCLSESIRLDPTNSEVYQYRAIVRDAYGDEGGALEDRIMVARLDPNETAHSVFERAETFRRLKPFDGDPPTSPGAERGLHRWATREYSIAIGLNPDFADALFCRGMLHEKWGRYRLALADYERCASVGYGSYASEPNVVQDRIAETRWLLTPWFGRLGRRRPRHLPLVVDAPLPGDRPETQPPSDDRQLQQSCDRPSLEFTPIGQWIERGLRSTEFRERLRCFSEAIKLAPDNPDMYLMRGMIRAKEGDLAGALLDYQEALRGRPWYHIAYRARAEVHERNGRYADAVADYGRYLEECGPDGGGRGTERELVEARIRELQQRLDSG